MRSRHFIFTWNNYPADWWDKLQEKNYRYICAGKETAPTTGTPHLQGCICFTNQRSLNAVKKLLPGCHVEAMRGTVQQAVDYCKKEGDWVEDGDQPITATGKGDQEKERWEIALELAKANRIEDIEADIQVRYYASLTKIAAAHMPVLRNLVRVCGLWIHGPSGCGKSTLARSMFPEAYPKPLNKWWDGYRSEEAVIIDDVDPSHSTWIASFLKYWADRFPFIAEIKGGSKKIRPRAIIVTSQYSITQVFSDQEAREALTRRFQRYEFTNLALPNFDLINFE